MGADFNREKPIYAQIVEKLESRIFSGYYRPGEKIPSVRELAVEMSVNPNTMQRAMAQLEREGILYSRRTAGRYITEDAQLLARLKKAMIQAEAENFINRLKEMGITKEEMLPALMEAGKEMEK